MKKKKEPTVAFLQLTPLQYKVILSKVNYQAKEVFVGSHEQCEEYIEGVLQKGYAPWYGGLLSANGYHRLKNGYRLEIVQY